MTQELTNIQKLSESDLGKIYKLKKQVQESKFLKMEDGEQCNLYFAISHPETKLVMVKGNTNGEEYENERMNFVVWNRDLERDQIFTTSKRTAKKILDKIVEYGTTALAVRRIGTGKSTTYDFLPIIQ